MDNNIEMTIIMPSYNRGKYIEEAIKSVLMQKVTFNYRLIIADDGSTDNSLEIANDYKEQYLDKIEVMPSKKNQGLLSNYIRVCEKMKTKYFCVLDADDYWIDAKFLQKAYNFLENNPEYVIYGCNVRIMRNGIVQEEWFNTGCDNEMTVVSIDDLMHNKKWNYVTQTLGTIFRNVIFKSGVPDFLKESIGTSSEASYREDTNRYLMHLKEGKAKYVNDTAGIYRLHENGIWSSRTSFHKEVYCARALIDYSKYYEKRYFDYFCKMSNENFVKATANLFCHIWNHNQMDMEDVHNYGDLLKGYVFTKEKEFAYDNKLLELIQNRQKRDIVVWGTSSAAIRLIDKYILMKNVSFFADNNSVKQGTSINGIKVLSPEQVKEYKQKKYIVIASSYYNEIIEGILEQRICDEEEIINLHKMDYKYSLIFEENYEY